MIRNLILTKLALLFVFALAGCASTSVEKIAVDTEDSLEKVYVTNSKAIHLLSPKYMEGTEDALYAFTGNFKSQRFNCLIYNQSNQEGISLLLTNELGLDMGNLIFAPGTASFTSSFFPSDLKAEYIIADFQNASYDIKALTANYQNAGLEFTVKSSADGSVRRIVSDKEVIEEITVTKSSMVIKNLLRGYTYILTRLE